MDIFITDPSEIPLPPDQVRIRQIKATPLDERRVRVYLEVDPFQKRPNTDLVIQDETGQVLASTTIIESMQRKIEIIMHLRGAQPGSTCTLQATLFFATLPKPGEDPNKPVEVEPMERQDVDRKAINFKI